MPGTQDDTVPGLDLDPKLAAKLDGLDEHLEPIKEELQEGDKPKKTEEKSPKDDTEESQEAESEEEQESEEDDQGSSEDGGDDSSADDGGASDDGDSSDEDADEGYTIDEGEEESEPEPTTSTEKAEDDSKSSQLTAEQQYIIDNLQPIMVRGTVGDSTEVKEYEVYSPEYLPEGFKYVDDKELSQATKAFSTLESRALQLQSDYRNQETQKASKEFQEREDAADRQDIATLQRAGEIPRFKAEPDSAEFESDSAVQLVQEVLDFKEAQNEKYLADFNAGRPYKHIGFEEAWRMFQRQNPTKSNPAQEKEDQERTSQAKRTSKTSSSSAKTEVNKPRVHSGMSSMDLENLIEEKTAAW